MSKIYRDFDQAALDAAYNNRAHVPEHPDHFAQWYAASERARAQLCHRADLAYGVGERQRLDYFPAASADGRPPPLFVFIHGGYWQALDHRCMSHLAPPLVDAGIAYASVSHELCPQASIGIIVEQIRQSIAWLWGRADELGFDRGRIFIGGHSSGGHLAAMLALTDFRQRGLPADAIKGGLALSGLYDLEPIRLCYLNATLKLDAAQACAASPAQMLPPPAGRRAAPLVFAVGAAELPEYLRQQREFAALWRAAGQVGADIELEGLNHFTVIDALANPGHALNRAVRDMISRSSVV